MTDSGTHRVTPDSDRAGDGAVELSPAGEARRAEILRRARGAQRWRVRRRRACQGAAGALILAVVAVTAILSPAPSAPQPGATAARDRDATPAPDPTADAPRVEFVTTSAEPYERAVATPSRPRAEIISDDELLRLLEAEGRSVGLIRTQGRVRVVGDLAATPPRSRPDGTSG